MSHLPLITVKTHLIEFIRHLQWEPLTIDIEIVGALSQCVHSLITRIQEQRLYVVHAPAPTNAKNRVYLELDVLPPENTQAVYLPSAAKASSRLEYRDVVISPLGPSETSDVESNSQQAQHKWTLQVTAELKIPLRYKKLFANFVKKTRPIFRVSFVWFDGNVWQKVDHDKIFHILNGNDGWQRYKPRVKKPGNEKKKKTVKKEKGFVNVFSAIDMRAMKPEPITVLETISDVNITSENDAQADSDSTEDNLEFAEIQRRQVIQSKLREVKQLQMEGIPELPVVETSNHLEPPHKKPRTNTYVKPESDRISDSIPNYTYDCNSNNYGNTNNTNNTTKHQKPAYYSTIPPSNYHVHTHVHNYQQVNNNEPVFQTSSPPHQPNQQQQQQQQQQGQQQQQQQQQIPFSQPPYQQPFRQSHHQQNSHLPAQHHRQQLQQLQQQLQQHRQQHQHQMPLSQFSAQLSGIPGNEVPTFVPYISPNKRTYQEMTHQHRSEEEDDVPVQPPIPSRAGIPRDTMGGVEDHFGIDEENPRFRRRPIFGNNNMNGKGNSQSVNFRNSNYGNFSSSFISEYDVHHHNNNTNTNNNNYQQQQSLDFMQIPPPPVVGNHMISSHVTNHHHTAGGHHHHHHSAGSGFDSYSETYFDYDYNSHVPLSQNNYGNGTGNFVGMSHVM